ncbi:MAG TPA: hypothetical protein VGS80_00780 [Ktedonobacterales bacterium]|nr:hypothetical protein [Ktedonobacterales bacterium]
MAKRPDYGLDSPVIVTGEAVLGILGLGAAAPTADVQHTLVAAPAHQP